MSALVSLRELRLVEKRRRMSRWVRRLRSVSAPPSAPPERTAVDQLVLEHLVDELGPRRAETGFQVLKREFVDWNEVRVSRQSELVKVLDAVSLTSDQAFTVRAVLARLFERNNALSLDHLRGKPLHEIDAALGALGVSMRARNATAFLRLGANVLSLSPGGLRVLKRLGAVHASAEADEALEELALVVAADRRADFYWLLSAHARETCKERGPLCPDCVFLKDCPTGQSRTARPRSTRPARGRRPAPGARRSPRRGAAKATAAKRTRKKAKG